MNATYTIRYEVPAAAHNVAAHARELAAAVGTPLMLVAAPLIGLVFVTAAPIAALALLAWTLTKALVARRAAVAAVVKRTALFAIAPFVGLAYFIAFPFVAMGLLGYHAVKALRS